MLPDLLLLLQRLLHPVLPHVLQTGTRGRPHRVGAMALGDGDDSDRMGPPRDRLMPGHRLTYPGETAGQVREFHSLAI